MPSIALLDWQGFALLRLAETEQQCLATPTGGLADENLRCYVMSLSGHFQEFCRDLYAECSQAVVNAVPVGLQLAVQRQTATGNQLDTANPKFDSIRQDFERFGIDLAAALGLARKQATWVLNPANDIRVTHIGQLNAWRNYCAHRMATPPGNSGGPLTIPLVRTWQDSCAGFATVLDSILYNQLLAITGSPPW